MSSHAVLISGDRAEYLVATATRAPSVHNTQPWLFRADVDAIELRYDRRRQLLADPTGREMLISCGAALFGLRLGMRSLGYQPSVVMFPEPNQPDLLARVSPLSGRPMSRTEREMLRAVPHRHTHRGPFEPGPLPSELLTWLRYEALAESGVLVRLSNWRVHQRVATLSTVASRDQCADSRARAEIHRWTHNIGSLARDGVSAHAFAAIPPYRADRFAQRDFDLGRGIGKLPQATDIPAAAAVLVTPGDTPADWIRAGQALHRVLLRAATQWVAADLQTQAMESVLIRSAVRRELGVQGMPQILLQFGLAHVAPATVRRPVDELMLPR
jgi:hypothetical protein